MKAFVDVLASLLVLAGGWIFGWLLGAANGGACGLLVGMSVLVSEVRRREMQSAGRHGVRALGGLMIVFGGVGLGFLAGMLALSAISGPVTKPTALVPLAMIGGLPGAACGLLLAFWVLAWLRKANEQVH